MRSSSSHWHPGSASVSKQTMQTPVLMAGGMIIGDMPPYEAFPIGGTNSVRGYSEGGAGTGRTYIAGTAELHVPLVSPVEVSISSSGLSSRAL